MKKHAVTLPEILIVLAILGLLSTLIVPTLIRKVTYKQFQVTLLKYNAVLEQVVTYQNTLNKRMVASQDRFLKLLPIFEDLTKVALVCDPSHYVSTTPSLACVEGQPEFYKTLQNTKPEHTIPGLLDDGAIVLADGVILYFENSQATKRKDCELRNPDNPSICEGNVEDYHDYSQQLAIAVDVNGLKKPNRLGYDLFFFGIDAKSGHLYPFKVTDEKFGGYIPLKCDPNGTDSLNGLGCTSDALSDPDYFKKLK